MPSVILAPPKVALEGEFSSWVKTVDLVLPISPTPHSWEVDELIIDEDKGFVRLINDADFIALVTDLNGNVVDQRTARSQLEFNINMPTQYFSLRGKYYLVPVTNQRLNFFVYKDDKPAQTINEQNSFYSPNNLAEKAISASGKYIVMAGPNGPSFLNSFRPRLIIYTGT